MAEDDCSRAPVKTRRDAMDAGEKTYTGRPCPVGHAGLRYTSGGNCVECLAAVARSEQKKAYDKAYIVANRLKIYARADAYAEKNAERIKACAKAWVEQNRDKVRAIKKTYKARRRTVELSGDTTQAIARWEKSVAKVCYWCGCGCKAKYHVDHYQPLSKGGAHAIANLVIACPSCNLRKSAKDPLAFANEVGRLF